MSSTNRKNASERHVADYYVTPADSIKEFLDAFNQDYCNDDYRRGDTTTPISIFDPCAGGDATHKMAYPWAIERFSGWNVNKLTTIDIRPDSLAEFKEDYLLRPPPVGADNMYDIAITNPPFAIALDVIQKCLGEVAEGGWVIMLLRLNFFGSQERSTWFKQNMPEVCYVHSKRMKFTNTGGTDSIEYMHACWRVGYNPKFTKLRIL